MGGGSGGGGSTTVKPPKQLLPFLEDATKQFHAASQIAGLGTAGFGGGFNFPFAGGAGSPSFPIGSPFPSPGGSPSFAQIGVPGGFSTAPSQAFPQLFTQAAGGEFVPFDLKGVRDSGFFPFEVPTKGGELLPPGSFKSPINVKGNRGAFPPSGDFPVGPFSVPTKGKNKQETIFPQSIGFPFPGPFQAPIDPLQLEALQRRELVGRSLAGIDLPLLQLGLDQASGAFLDPASNPFLQDVIDASVRPVGEQFFEKMLPSFRSQAIESGAFKGSSRRDLTEAGMFRDFGRTIGDIASTIAFDNFARERQLQQQAPQLLDAAVRLSQIEPAILGEVGAGRRSLAQLGVDEQIRRFEETLEAPFRPLLPLVSSLQGLGPLFGQVSSGPGIGGGTGSAVGSGITGALGGAATGASLGSVVPGIGTGLGAALGGILGGVGGFL